MDFLSSFFQNIKDKLTSPFLGTFTFIIIVHHWIFWYSLFNFDKGHNLAYKSAYLGKLASIELSALNIFYDALLAILITVLGYGILIGTKTLSLFVDHKIMPSITGKIIDKLVVLKSTHEDVVKERDEYSDKYEEQRKQVRELSKDYDKQTEQISEKNELLSTLNDQALEFQKNLATESAKNIELSTENSKMNSEILEYKKSLTKANVDKADLEYRLIAASIDLQEYFDLYFSDLNVPYYKDQLNFPPTIIANARDLHAMNRWNEFIQVGRYTEGKIGVDKKIIDLFKNTDLISVDNNDRVRLSAIGRILYKYYNIFSKKNNF